MDATTGLPTKRFESISQTWMKSQKRSVNWSVLLFRRKEIVLFQLHVPKNISPPTIPLTKGTGEVFGNCCIQEEGAGKALEVPSPLVWLPWRRPRTSPLFLGRDNTLGMALPKAQQIERSTLKQRYRCKACTLLWWIFHQAFKKLSMCRQTSCS